MDNEKLFTLIKSPIITEQTALLGENLKQIVFKVDLSANKREIKQAVEKLFNVEVLKVTTSVVKGKTKRNRFGVYRKSNYKKAFVSITLTCSSLSEICKCISIHMRLLNRILFTYHMISFPGISMSYI